MGSKRREFEKAGMASAIALGHPVTHWFNGERHMFMGMAPSPTPIPAPDSADKRLQSPSG